MRDLCDVLFSQKRWFQALLVVLNPVLVGSRRPIHVIQGIGKDASVGSWGTHSVQNCGAYSRCRILGSGSVVFGFEKKSSLPPFEMQLFFVNLLLSNLGMCANVCATLFFHEHWCGIHPVFAWYFGGWWVPGIFKLEVFNRDPHDLEMCFVIAQFPMETYRNCMDFNS